MNNIKNYLDYLHVFRKYYFKVNNPSSTMYRDLSNDLFKKRHLNYEIINEHYLNDIDGSIIISNHQDNIDIFLLLKIFPFEVKFVAKKELFTMPLVKKFIIKANAYSIDRDDARQSLLVLKEVVKNGNQNNENVIIFPEGTRSRSSIIGPFKSGLFNIIKKSNKPIIPIYIDGSYLEANTTIKVYIGKPLLPSTFNSLKGHKLKDDVFETITQMKKEIQEPLFTMACITNESKDIESDNIFSNITTILNQQGFLKKFYHYDIEQLDIKTFNQLLNDNKVKERLIKADYILVEPSYENIIIQKELSQSIKDISLKLKEINPKVHVFVLGKFIASTKVNDYVAIQNSISDDLILKEHFNNIDNISYLSGYDLLKLTLHNYQEKPLDFIMKQYEEVVSEYVIAYFQKRY
ncbi:MAG: lysophospholipid acyltransferase family protein [Bacilli bacterium]